MLDLLMQPQKELQLYLKTNNAQNCQKIELYGSLTAKDLKKPHSSGGIGGAEMQCVMARQQRQNRWSHIDVWWIEIRRDASGASNPAPGHTAQLQIPVPGR